MVDAECDYLVVGAGTAGMSFIDTLLSENSTVKVILVDRNDKPGGHWTKAYPFVKLHQSGCYYGVNSRKLGKNLDKNGNEKWDVQDRATGEEIVEYYAKVLQSFQMTDRFTSYFGAEYQGEKSSTSSLSPDSSSYSATTIHSIATNSGNILHIRCKKLVMIHTKVIVPSMRKSPFPVHEEVNFITVNDLATQKEKYTNFVILGAGKTSTDAIIELLDSGVDQSCIKWVISQDVWFLIRDKVWPKNKSHHFAQNRFIAPFLTKNSVKDCFLAYEKDGILGRLDPHGTFPEIFRGPLINYNELKLLRTIKDVVRQGRVTSIKADGVMVFGAKDGDCKEGLEVHLSSSNDSTVFVDCMAVDLYGYVSFPEGMKIFEPNKINLGPLPFLFNPSLTSALTAYMETKTEDDATKNACFCYSTNVSISSRYVELLRFFYFHLKTVTFLERICPAALKFFITSRTNQDAIIHHGGLWKTLWAQLGPLQLMKKTKKFIERVEAGAFCDFKIEKEFVDRQCPPKVKVKKDHHFNCLHSCRKESI